MKLLTSKLEFKLPDNLLQEQIEQLDQLCDDLEYLASKAGTENNKFKLAYSSMVAAIQNNKSLIKELDQPIKIRALAMLLQSEWSERINLTSRTFEKIFKIKPLPSPLFIQSVFQYYLTEYDHLKNRSYIADWLLQAMKKRKMYKTFHSELLSSNGPKWLANQCIVKKRDFVNQVEFLKLDTYAAGRYLTVAKQMYFIEQLKLIPSNKPHDLLLEVQKESVFNIEYNPSFLLGHKILEILIKRAPVSDIDVSWLNVVMAIAGDPRISKSHPKYIKWWSQLDNGLIHKVRGWLSRLDLKLFLEALENYSEQSGKEDLKRMFPSRKYFLEGLHNRGVITHTRLYLSRDAATYLERIYKGEDLPSYSIVSNGDKSIIHVELGDSHIIEGSHSCYLWIYKRMHRSSIVFDYSIEKASYSSLTVDLSHKMRLKKTPHLTNITHNLVNFGWQHEAIKSLNSIDVAISAQDVLSDKDYKLYKRRYGVN